MVDTGVSSILAEVKVVTNESKRATIAILQRTKDGLDSIKHPGQTYDGVIQELIDLWKKVKEKAARPVQRS